MLSALVLVGPEALVYVPKRLGGGLGLELGFKLGLRFKLGSRVKVSVCTPKIGRGKEKKVSLRWRLSRGRGVGDGKIGTRKARWRREGKRWRREGGREGEREGERGLCMLAGSMQCREGHYRMAKPSRATGGGGSEGGR